MMNETRAPSGLGEHTVDGVVVLAIERGLKGVGEAALKQRVDTLVRQRCLDILIDMKQMPFIDSAELGRLIRSHISVRQAGGRVRLCNLSLRVAALMKLTRLDTVLEIYDTEDQALTVIRQHREQQSQVTAPLG